MRVRGKRAGSVDMVDGSKRAEPPLITNDRV